MVELVYTLVLEASAERLEGSSPSLGTNKSKKNINKINEKNAVQSKKSRI